MKRFEFDPDGDVAEDIRTKYGHDSDLLKIYAGTKDVQVNKWHHYIPIYDRYFSPYRGKPIKMLEIGVKKGGSLKMWREYFGDEAIIYGIDIDEKCREFDGQAAQVRIGSQDDPEFLDEVVDEMGGVDIVLDDGSHVMQHIMASLMALYPRLSNGGLYAIEDLHTAFWPGFGGGLKSRGNFFNRVRRMVDDMHRWYHDGKPTFPQMDKAISGIHIHDSMCLFEKAEIPKPPFSRVT